ncbi:MAG: hypothetical protein ACJAV1_001409, partial [Paraglaciecola sp.]
YLRHKTGDLKILQNKLINISSSNVEPLTSDDDVVVNPDPTQLNGIYPITLKSYSIALCLLSNIQQSMY